MQWGEQKLRRRRRARGKVYMASPPPLLRTNVVQRQALESPLAKKADLISVSRHDASPRPKSRCAMSLHARALGGHPVDFLALRLK